MKKMILRLVLLIGLLSILPLTVSAEIEEGGPNYYYFTTFEDLKELTKLADSSLYAVTAIFERGELVIEEDLTIPTNFIVETKFSRVVVPEGVTLTVSERSWFDSNGVLEINGAVDVYGITKVHSLVINGKLNIWSSVTYQEAQGAEKITYKSDAAYVHKIITCFNMDELMEILVESGDRSQNVRYGIYFYATYAGYPHGGVIIDSTITIPQNVSVAIYSDYGKVPIIITKNGTLIVEGLLDIFLPLQVEGSLVNESMISINKTDDSRDINFYSGKGDPYKYGYGYGEMDISSSGTYSGDGEIGISDWIQSNPESIVKGIDFSGFDITNTGPDYYNYWRLRKHSHVYGDWTVTQEATCTTEGSRTRSCECGETETETIPAVGHTEVVDAAVAATCTADGKTEGKHCSVCDQVLTAQEAIPATGHDTQGDTEFVWSEDHSACTLEVGCTACGQKQSVACTVTSEVVNGTIVYRACVDFNGMSFSDAQQGGAAEAPAAWGDVSGDGWVDSFDASLIMKYDVMLIGDNDLNLAAADVSGDGYVDS